LGGPGNWFIRDLPVIIAFAVLATYTYSSGLRAPALIAFVNDSLIHLVIIVAVVFIFIGVKIGFHGTFDAAQAKMGKTKGGSFIPSSSSCWAYGSLAFGSAFALFMCPHSVTGVLSAKSRNVIRRNAAILPTYSLMLGMLALLGFVLPHFFAQCFPAGSPSRRSRSARSCLPRSCPSRLRTCSPLTSTASSSRLAPPRAGGSGLQDHVVGREIRRPALRARSGPSERDRPTAAGRRLDPADDRGGRWGLYAKWFHHWALTRGLGDGHDLGHARRLPPGVHDHQTFRQLASGVPGYEH
jgi:hypothetical protein